MKQLFLFAFIIMLSFTALAQKYHDAYKQNKTLTYSALIDEYKKLDAASGQMKLLEYPGTDAGYPIHLLVINAQKNFTFPSRDRKDQVVFLIMNGIHPGESEGIDASLLFAQQIAYGKISLPSNVTLCIIPVYNVEGMLNRREHTRTNQNGPIEKGFRGTARNFDLNRDFIKADTKNTFAFYRIYHDWDPDVFIDNHTSNGADYQYTMTLISTQAQKLGGKAGDFLSSKMSPALYAEMSAKKSEMVPYVHLFGKSPDEEGFEEFIESPKYSTGYTTLFGTIGFVAETHMLKPYPARVDATLALQETILNFMKKEAGQIRAVRMEDQREYVKAISYATNFKIDKSRSIPFMFKGYEAEMRSSELGNYKRMFYDRNKPYSKEVPYYNYAVPGLVVNLPKAYLIPKSWYPVIERLKANKVQMRQLQRDTVITVTSYYITRYESYGKPYESHHTNYNVETEEKRDTILFRSGDYIVPTAQLAGRYIAEVLEPKTEDGFFAWNFFDGILNAKEGFSDYVFEDDAVKMVANDPELKRKLEEWKAANPDKKDNGREVLGFIFRNSFLYEPEHMRVPVFRIEKR